MRAPLLLLLAVPIQAQALVAEYNAGDAGAPATAPDPQTQGWTLTDPSNGAVLVGDMSPDGGTGMNGWRIEDQVQFNGARAHYGRPFTPLDLDQGEDYGWQIEAVMRPLASGGLCLVLDFATGQTSSDQRYLLWFEVQGNDVLVTSNLTGAFFICPGAMDGNYHTFSLRKPAGMTNTTADFLYDGVNLGALPAAASNANAPAGGLNWGSGSSGGTGTAHWNRVSFYKGTDTMMLGSKYCTPANTNSSGQAGWIEAAGNPLAESGLLRLYASQMPANQIGYFVLGDAQGFVSPGNSQGNLCVSGNLGRFASQLSSTGATGAFAIQVDTNALPTWPSTPLMPGQTWHFQAWFTDQNPGPTSNFTDGISITFQ